MLSIRHKTMLRFILEHPEGVSGKQLSGQLRVSGKTIRNDVAAINSQLKERGLHISASQKQGYYIEENEKEQVRRTLEEQQFPLNSREVQTPEERRFAILDRALGHPGIGIEKIAEHLCVSEQTIYKDIAYLQQKLGPICNFGGLAVQNHRVYLHGTEEEIRCLVFRLICVCVSQSGQLLDGNLHQLMNGIVNLHEICTFYEYAQTYACSREMKVTEQTLFLGVWMIFYVNVRREEAYFLEGRKAVYHRDQLWDFLDYMNRSLFLELEDCDMEFLYKALGCVGFPASGGREAEEAREIMGRLSAELEAQYGLVFEDEMGEIFLEELTCVVRRVRTGYQFCDWRQCDREALGTCFYNAGILGAYLVRKRMGIYLTMAEVCRLGEYIRTCTRRERERIRIQMVYGKDMGQYYRVHRWIEDKLRDETEICGACPGYLLEKEWIRNKPDLIMGVQHCGGSWETPCVGMPEFLTPGEEGKIRKFLKNTIEKERAASCVSYMISGNRVAFLESGVSFEEMVRICAEILEQEGCIARKKDFAWDLLDRQRQYPCRTQKGYWLLQPFSRQAVSDGIAATVERGTGGKVVLVCAFRAGLEKHIGGQMVTDSLEKLLDSRDFAGKLKTADNGEAAAFLIVNRVREVGLG